MIWGVLNNANVWQSSGKFSNNRVLFGLVISLSPVNHFLIFFLVGLDDDNIRLFLGQSDGSCAAVYSGSYFCEPDIIC